jgi:hypothetical protein
LIAERDNPAHEHVLIHRSGFYAWKAPSRAFANRKGVHSLSLLALSLMAKPEAQLEGSLPQSTDSPLHGLGNL